MKYNPIVTQSVSLFLKIYLKIKNTERNIQVYEKNLRSFAKQYTEDNTKKNIIEYFMIFLFFIFRIKNDFSFSS